MKPIIIFCITYFGIAIGGIPGLAINRTGIALLGAIAMVVLSAVNPAEALNSIDFPTILLLYGLMIISAQFRISGFYSFIAQKISSGLYSPGFLLFMIMLAAAAFSSVLTNDIVCLAFTPVMATVLLKQKLNPAPFLIGLAIAANIGSAATIIGNPQNLLIGQSGNLSFALFIRWCFPPVIASLIAAYGILLYLYKNNLERSIPLTKEQMESISMETSRQFNFHQIAKGIMILITVLVLFFTPVPRELTVIVAAAILMISRTTKTIELLERVDWNLLTLFCGLFIVIQGINTTGIPFYFVEYLNLNGINIHNLNILSVLSVLLSNIVSIVPAVMLMISHLDKANPVEWYVLALSSSFAGNLFIIGSIANIITFEIAGSLGILVSFKEHARTGIPVTLVTIGILMLWVAFTKLF
jgi:Na+/H+ antiporter NhaD/arsenite permease-like protein